LIEDPARELVKVANLLGIEPSPERLARAADLSSADRMRQLEQTQGKKWVQTRYTRQDKPFVRKAASGGWKAVLSPKSVAAIEAAWSDIMTSIGYPLSSGIETNTTLVHPGGN
jgi:Sulfotransferase domain